MMGIKSKILCAICGLVGAMATAANAAPLSGTASVNITSETAAAAKNIAMDEARRQILFEKLSQYSMPDQLRDAIGAATNADLMNLVGATNISGEQQSDTTYSANITMVIDNAAATNWMNGAGVQNWMPAATGGDKFTVVANMADPIANWANLQEIARAEKIDLATKYIDATTATIELPVAVRGEFTAALRAAGWKYADDNGVLRISK